MAETKKKTRASGKDMTTVHQELVALRKEVQEIKQLLREDYELSSNAKKALREARQTPRSQYVDLT
jgi:hypothetical protein